MEFLSSFFLHLENVRFGLMNKAIISGSYWTRPDRTVLLEAHACKRYRVGFSSKGRLPKGWCMGEWLFTRKNVRIPPEGNGDVNGERERRTEAEER